MGLFSPFRDSEEYNTREPTEQEIIQADIKDLKERVKELERIVDQHRITIYGPSAEDE